MLERDRKFCEHQSALYSLYSTRFPPPVPLAEHRTTPCYLSSATSRLLLHSNIHDKVVAKILERAASVTVGGPLRGDDKTADGTCMGPLDGTCMGPLVSGPQRDKVLGFISRVRWKEREKDEEMGEE